MARPKGQPKLGGRKKGTPNKVSRSAKEAYVEVFERLGGADGLLEWAMRDPANLRDFYNWHSSKLIPTEKEMRVDLGHLDKMTDAELEARAKELGVTL